MCVPSSFSHVSSSCAPLWRTTALACVVGVSDDDTVKVFAPDKKQIKVRLFDIDEPETGQDFGAKAKQIRSKLAFVKDVKMRPDDTDLYGPAVAEVIMADGRCPNHELLERGMAWGYRQYARNAPRLASSEYCARKIRIEISSQPRPIPPWEWRKRTGASPKAGSVGDRNSQVYHLSNCRGVA